MGWHSIAATELVGDDGMHSILPIMYLPLSWTVLDMDVGIYITYLHTNLPDLLFHLSHGIPCHVGLIHRMNASESPSRSTYLPTYLTNQLRWDLPTEQACLIPAA